MNLIQALLIGVLYYFANSTWNFSMGLYTIYRPLVGGLFVGLILGDPQTGLEMGLKIQFIYMGFMSTGGSMPSDSTLAGLIGTSLAILLKPDMGDAALDAALTMAVAIGMLGTFLWVGRMTWNTIFVQKASEAAQKGDLRGMFRWHVTIPQLVVAVVCIVPVTMFLMAVGDPGVLSWINKGIGYVLTPLTAIGQLLPTLGLAITLNAIGQKKTIPFFFVGFVLSQYLKMDIIGISIIGICAAYLIYFAFDGNKTLDTGTNVDVSSEEDDAWS